MEMDLFKIHLNLFFKEFGILNTPEARTTKLLEEVLEFYKAVHSESIERANDEALDVLICALANVWARGFKNPLDAAYLKLERTAEKYRNKTSSTKRI